MADAPFREGPTLLGVTAATLFTVPVGSDFTVRNIHVCNTNAVDALLTLSIGPDGTSNRLYRNVLIEGDGGVFDWSGYMPLAAGEFMQGYASIIDALVVTISGVDTT
jgi:hypothetical protein